MCIVSGPVWRFVLRQNFAIQTEPGSDPASSAKEEQKAAGNCDHHCDRQGISEFILQFRHVVKIHTVKTRDKTERHEQRGDHGECFHDLVTAQTDFCQMKITQVGAKFGSAWRSMDPGSAPIPVERLNPR